MVVRTFFTARRSARRPRLREKVLAGLVSLRTRLLLLILFPGLLALLVQAWFGGKIVRQFEQVEIEHARFVAQVARYNLQQQVRNGRAFLELLVQRVPSLRPDRPAECHLALARMRLHYPQYQNFGFIDRAGNVLCSAIPGRVNFADRPHVKKVFDSGDFAFGPYQVGRLSGQPQIPLVLPVEPSPRHGAVLVFTAVSPRLLQTGIHQTALPGGSRLVVTDEHGVVLQHEPDDPTSRIREGERFITFDIISLLADRDEAEARVTGRDAVQRHYLAYRLDLGQSRLYMAIGVPVKELHNQAWALSRQAMVWIAGLLLFTLVLALWGIRVTVMDKLDRLNAAMRRVTGGDLAARAGIAPGRSELRQLATVFNCMTASLQSLRSVILDAVSEGVFGVDEQGFLIFINEAGARLLGYTPTELIGRSIEGILLHPPLRTDAAATRSDSELLRHKNGRNLSVEYSAGPLITDGQRVGTVVAFTDVSQRHPMEVELHTITDNLPGPLLRLDSELRCLFANAAVEKLTSQPRTALVGHAWSNISLLAGAAAWLPSAIRSLTDGQIRNVSVSCNTAAGRRHFEVQLVPEVDADGHPGSLLLIGNDVTGEKIATEVIRRNDSRIIRSQEALHFGNWEWNHQTGQRYWSAEIFHILGLDPKGFDNTFDAFLTIVHPDDRDRVRKAVLAAQENGQHYQLEYRIVRSDGSERMILEIGDALRNESGGQVGVEGTMLDFTEQKRLQEAVQRLNQTLEQQTPPRTMDILLDEEKAFLSRIQLPPDETNH